VQEAVDDGFSMQGHPSAVEEAGRRAVLRGIVKSRAALQGRIRVARDRGFATISQPAGPVQSQVMQRPFEALVDDVRKHLKSPKTGDELKRYTGATGDELADAISALRDKGVAVKATGGGNSFVIDAGGQPAYVDGQFLEFTSRPDNTFSFGIAGDKHIGSKYHRDDVLYDLYRRFEDRGVDAVFDTGNWIDGDARFNRHDLLVHGLDPQIALMAETHPKIADVTTYAVWGDDHEGWYAQREGIDVGRYAEGIMTAAGHQWVNLGFMEAHVKLVNANTGKHCLISIMHPGGGSAYALSYRPQKIIESMEGGEKPAAIFMGHYHKLEVLNVRNIWAVQAGCCEDQTPFMRKRSIEAHVGGVLAHLEQDPETGALVALDAGMRRYFNRGYYNNRWSYHGDVSRPERKG